MPNTSNEQLKDSFDQLKKSYQSHRYLSAEERLSLLRKLKTQMEAHEKNIYKALSDDYGYRSEFDSMVTEFLPTINSIKFISGKLKKWMRPSKRHAGLLLAPSKVEVQYQPLGVVGIIVPWNFPINLSLVPLITALAAGNRVMMKMSEFTPKTNQALREMLKPLEDHVVLVEGEADIAAEFTKLPFNHILFTGSTAVGKHVARAAAENLTPITLELGGKSPTIITKNANLDAGVDAVITGKALNSGQICVAPDYIFIHESLKDQFIKLFQEKFIAYYKNENANFRYTCIINSNHYKRINDLCQDAISKGAQAHSTIENNEPTNREHRLYPTLLTDVNDEMEVMKHEIFGSLLPIMTYKDIQSPIDYINKNPRPLALYIMSDNNAEIERVLKHTHSGGVSVNDTIFHVGAEDAPFGGIGDSGMGHYHGIEGFKTFSHAKTVLKSKSWLPKNGYILKNRDKMYAVMRKYLM
jgi:coniferyl-aldehyde dehydrogenase